MDSSAFVKLFILEPGSDRMVGFANAEAGHGMIASALARVEARSAICKLRQIAGITPLEASSAIARLMRDLSRIKQQPLTDVVLEAASDLVDRHALRALDAVQLGSAIAARNIFSSPDMRFICSDAALLRAARAESFEIWDPTA